MPDNPLRQRPFCRYCQDSYTAGADAAHATSPEHQASVRRWKRSGAYRSRQAELPGFPGKNLPTTRR